MLLSNHCGIETKKEDRTIIQRDGYYRTIVELKQDYNYVEPYSERRYYRTIVELKHDYIREHPNEVLRYYRTIVELKQKIVQYYNMLFVVIIEPLWN